MITRTKAKTDFEKDFFKLINKSVWEGYRKCKHRSIKLKATDKRRIYLVSELDYHTEKPFSDNLLAVKRK